MLLVSSADCFQTFSKPLTFSKNSFWNIIRVSNSLDPDQDRQNVGPDLGPNYFQRLSADDKSFVVTSKERVKPQRATYNLQQTTISNFAAFFKNNK